MAREPDISVVVASFCGSSVLQRCLTRLAKQAGDETEVIAVSALRRDQVAELSRNHPGVRFVSNEVEEEWQDPRLEETRVFRLRSAGVAAATGRIVVLLEDHAVIAPGWLDALKRGHEVDGRIVGGPVDPGADASLYVWALYLCEYVQLISPMPRGGAGYLSGVNVSYPREALEACRKVWEVSFLENEVNDALCEAGHELWLEPEALIGSELAFPFARARQHLFVGGWRFGCYRRERSRGSELWKWRLTLPLVPLFHLWRILKVMLSRRPARLHKLILGLPVVIVLVSAWALGEARGLIGSASTADFTPPGRDA